MNLRTAMRGCFVSGTDTEVGKTCISAALLHRVASHGRRAAGFKPVAAGTVVVDGRRVNEDVQALRQAGSMPLSDAEVGPFQFDAACAPHVAAALEGRAIDRVAILTAGRRLLARCDFLVVEGVGGFCVPLGADWDSSHIACGLGLPVILVVGLRLGCLNHALLTVEAILARRLQLAGWVGNTIDQQMPYRAETIQTLEHELGRRRRVPCLGIVPWLDRPDPASVAAHFGDTALQTAFGLVQTPSSPPVPARAR